MRSCERKGLHTLRSVISVKLQRFQTEHFSTISKRKMSCVPIREEHRFLDHVDGLPFDQRIVIFYCYWADYMEDLGLDFCTDFYHTRNYSLDIRRWNQREPVFIWNYPGECLSEAKQDGLLKEGMTVDHCAEVLGTLMKGIAFDWCLSNGSFEMKPRVQEVMGPYLESIKQ